MNGESIETSESNSIQTHQNLNGNGKVKGKGKGTGKAIENTNNTHQSTSHRSHRSHHSNHRSSYLSSFQRRHQQQSRRHRFPDNSLRFPSDHQTGEDPIQSYIPHHHHHDDDEEEDEDNLSNSSFTDQSHDSDYSPQSSMLAYSSEPEDGLLRLRIHESRQQHLLRHGFNEAYNSDEYLEGLAKTYFMYWDDTPYKTTKPSDLKQIPFWRPPVKHRTVCAALFLCLRLGFDPPDVVKTSPAPKLEAWVDPKMYPKESVLETIAKRLQDQFESLAPPHARVKFKTYPDVYSEEFKKTLIGLRKYSKNDRCLVYYNGHGVPKPTQTGELWVFNKAYTQYIPISIADILSWAGPPSVFIWDCNNAGHIVNAIIQASATKDEEIAAELELRRLQGSSGSQIPQFLLQNPAIRYSDTIQLAACQADQMLPRDPEAPADIFTACLSSPIEMALRFYVLRNNARDANWTSTAEFFNDLGKIDKVPGRMEMRRTPLGELTWIFTSIADAIAWNHLDRHLFTRIFRGDLVLAALFRGFLLAERVMRAYGCTPISMPKLPPTHQSELWKCWDLEVDMCLSQLPAIWRSEAIRAEYDMIPYRTSTFFSQQLTAFELCRPGDDLYPPSPPQLPIVLQVLLSQLHRLRALILLCRFMDLGPWAVHLSLSIGIFQYVLKLLQAPAAELRPVLIFIWARILTVYPEGRMELFRPAPVEYFVRLLAPHTPELLPVANVVDHKAMCAFILSIGCKNLPAHANRLLNLGVLEILVHRLPELVASQRQWYLILLAHLWEQSGAAKGRAIRMGVHTVVSELLTDTVPEVRTAAMYAFGTLLGVSTDPNGIGEIEDELINSAMVCCHSSNDGSPMLRKELVIVLSALVDQHLGEFIVAAFLAGQSNEEAKVMKTSDLIKKYRNEEDARKYGNGMNGNESIKPYLWLQYSSIYQILLDLTLDPVEEVSEAAIIVVDYIHSRLTSSTPFARSPETTEDGPSRLQNRLRNVGVNVGTDRKSEEETRANPRSSSNPSSIDTPISLLWERRSKLGSSEVPLETIIARTRLSDDERRQRQRVYPLLTKSVNTHQESTFDYLIYLGLHDSEELKVEGNQRKRNLPLRSSYYNLSCFVFLKPRMADKEVGMVGEETQIKALWRKNRNEKIILESQPLKADAARLPWDRIVNEWKTESVVSQVVMHQFEDQIITSDIDGYLTVYDTENKIKLNRFKNSDDRRGGSRITSVKLVNEDDVALVLTGTADGNVRIFRNYERKPELVTGFKSLPNSEPSKVGSSGLILDWQQSSGLLLCGGDSREIKVWNSKKEMCIENIKTRSGSPLTSLSSDHVSSFIICAGFGDGSIRVYDRRESLKSSMVRVYKAIHRSWVHTLHMQRGGQRELVSGDSCGDVVQWDVRLDQPLRFFRAHDDGMPALDIHEHAPVFAT
ncbi:uncharacterized protein MELLADRAFT_36026 [Melampsora larici-populina 98AG31]|uniref:Raptor N-terminal CASPase-like domain-containing protein n=1 Tax=Melampsora larici-populina (strain 98AG31 / pathotype 3-4-7) TaxID=747676 RepID=F4RLY3_MELLP|nr:uncharacterized protein MELLADRAFT_36026 [Melampsora larici-populina 98AG31]EGG06627.1 hypothetical protein MELLADRAFT_36026 [Melampsora larici-populina 98AG31]